MPRQPERPASTATEQFERAVAGGLPPSQYELALYVAGAGPRSLRAISVVTRLCEEYLAGRYDLQVIDIYQDPGLAESAGILAVPALIRRRPGPVVTLVGDMSNLDHVMNSLGLGPRRAGGNAK